MRQRQQLVARASDLDQRCGAGCRDCSGQARCPVSSNKADRPRPGAPSARAHFSKGDGVAGRVALPSGERRGRPPQSCIPEFGTTLAGSVLIGLARVPTPPTHPLRDILARQTRMVSERPGRNHPRAPGQWPLPPPPAVAELVLAAAITTLWRTRQQRKRNIQKKHGHDSPLPQGLSLRPQVHIRKLASPQFGTGLLVPRRGFSPSPRSGQETTVSSAFRANDRLKITLHAQFARE